MPDQNLPQPFEPPTVAPAPQGDGQQQSGPVRGNLVDPAGTSPDQSNSDQINPMQSTPNATAAPISAPPSPNPGETPQRIPYWLQQAERFLRVVVRMYLGLLVCCAPWYPAAWDNNPLFASSPSLLAFITHGAVRGIVSGLGILNLWIALREALRSPTDPNAR